MLDRPSPDDLDESKLYKTSDSTIYFVNPHQQDPSTIEAFYKAHCPLDRRDPRIDRCYDFAYGEGNRYLLCRCYAGEAWSATVRRPQNAPTGIEYQYDVNNTDHWFESDNNGYKPDQGLGKFLFSIEDLTKAFYDILFGVPTEPPKPNGLLVVTGSTNAAKSQIARGLIGGVKYFV